MNIEQVRDFALSLSPEVTEELFAEQWISWRIGGKWFLLMQLDAPEPRVAGHNKTNKQPHKQCEN